MGVAGGGILGPMWRPCASSMYHSLSQQSLSHALIHRCHQENNTSSSGPGSIFSLLREPKAKQRMAAAVHVQ
jgi:hypothetical protein